MTSSAPGVEPATDQESPPSKLPGVVWAGLGLTMALLLGVAFLGFSVLRPSRHTLPVYGQVADFALTNQAGQAVSLADLQGKVWVADIIFTRCAGPCLRMSRQMKELQAELPSNANVRLVSLTTDPDYDQPPVLKIYADRFGANPARWWFLTGTKAQVARLAVDSLKLSAVETKPEERENPQDLFIHSTIFVLVDQRAQLRGVFETSGETSDRPAAKRQLLAAVRQLAKER